jgi:hypothetical protein
MVSGAVLIAVGIAFVAIQMYLAVYHPEIPFPERGASLANSALTATVKTTYVGLIMIVVGAFLETVGYLGERPWTHTAVEQKTPWSPLAKP